MSFVKYSALAQTFYFDGFERAPKGRIIFHYSTDRGHTFSHEIAVSTPDGFDLSTADSAVFALGMAELVGYWKAILAPKIVIKAGALSGEQIDFWEKLYTKGLGEFFYKNEIDFRGLINIESEKDAPKYEAKEINRKGTLVPFGGGKDSLVSGEILKETGKDFTWFELETLPFSKKLMEVSENTKTISIERNVENNFKPVLELVKNNGAPNGHVPITSVYIFSSVLVAEAYGFSDIVFSLERSAEEGNIDYLGMNINHQYSKSFEFEKEVSEYVKKYIAKDVNVFSLLRPFYEIQIVEKFSKLEKYFPSFISCNKGLKTSSWCGECAKCAFMFAGLSAFLPPKTVESIWKKNLFEDRNLIPLYKDMVGLGSSKPFDCVGTFNENLLALFLSGEQYKKAELDLPAVLKELPIHEGEKYINLLKEIGSEHIVPKEYTYDIRK